MKAEDCDGCKHCITDHEDNELCEYYMKAISEVDECEILDNNKS